MELILKAIKSLFRKAENAITQTASTLSARIDKLDVKIKNAKTAADNAKTAADNAKTAADNAKTAAEKQVDWNEPDETSPSYVKNRTHYKEDYMREFDTVYRGPLTNDSSNPFGVETSVKGDIANALNAGMNNVTVEYRYDETSDWTVARASKNGDNMYVYASPEGTYLFYYQVSGARFLNNFTTSKPNLYLRFSGSVPDVRYVPLDERYMPDSTRETIAAALSASVPVLIGKKNGTSLKATCTSISEYRTNMAVLVIPEEDINSGNVDLQINDLATKSIKLFDGDSSEFMAGLGVNDRWAVAGRPLLLVFNGTHWLVCNRKYERLRVVSAICETEADVSDKVINHSGHNLDLSDGFTVYVRFTNVGVTYVRSLKFGSINAIKVMDNTGNMNISSTSKIYKFVYINGSFYYMGCSV